MECALAHRVARRVAVEAAGLGQGWVRDLFTAFCGWDRLRRARGDMPKHIGAYARFFAVIDHGCRDEGEVTQAGLVGLHGAEGLRRGFQAVAFLAERLALDWDFDALVAATERGRVKTTVAAARAEPWARDLDDYRAHLADGRRLAPATVRMYVSSAAALLRESGVGRSSELTQRHLARHMRRAPGRRTNLMRFLSWVERGTDQGFDLGKGKRTPVKKRERMVLKKTSFLLGGLCTAVGRAERRAMLAAATSVLHGIPLCEVLALRRDGAAGSGGATTVGRGGPVELTGPLAPELDGIATAPGALLFAGRNGLQPLSTAAVVHHVRRRPGSG